MVKSTKPEDHKQPDKLKEYKDWAAPMFHPDYGGVAIGRFDKLRARARLITEKLFETPRPQRPDNFNLIKTLNAIVNIIASRNTTWTMKPHKGKKSKLAKQSMDIAATLEKLETVLLREGNSALDTLGIFYNAFRQCECGQTPDFLALRIGLNQLKLVAGHEANRHEESRHAPNSATKEFQIAVPIRALYEQIFETKATITTDEVTGQVKGRFVAFALYLENETNPFLDTAATPNTVKSAFRRKLPNGGSRVHDFDF